MSKERWLFIGTDERIAICQTLMLNEGEDCRLVKEDGYSATLEKVLLDYAPDHIVFPVLQMKDAIPASLFKSEARLYIGIASPKWLAPFQQAALVTVSYLDEALYVWENARITAEALLKEFYEETKKTIYGTSFYVAGYGRVGKMVAQMLAGMGGDVTIIASEENEIAEAKLHSYEVRALTEALPNDDYYLINTIPARWLSEDKTNPLFIFDVASSPGCLTEAGAFEYYKLLPGLPGKHFPIASAYALKAVLNRIK